LAKVANKHFSLAIEQKVKTFTGIPWASFVFLYISF